MCEKLFEYYTANNGLLMALQDSNLKSLLEKAKELEKKYEWLQAAEYYKKALELNSNEKDGLEVVELQERIGFCYDRTAFQAKTTKQYERMVNKAIETFEKAVVLYNLSEKDERKTKIIRTRARILFLMSLITTGQSKKEELVDESLALEKKAFEIYRKDGDDLGIGRVCNTIMEIRYAKLISESTWKKVKESVEDINKYGEMAIAALSKVNDTYELALAYSLLSRITPQDLSTLSLRTRNKLRQKRLMYSKKASELSEKIEDAYLRFMSNWNASFVAWWLEDDLASALKLCEKAGKYAEKTKDVLLIATAKQAISTITYPLTLQEEDSDIQKEGFKKAFEIAQDAIKNFQLINHTPQSLESYRVSVESLTWLASIETNPDNKRSILEKAIRIGYEGLKYNQGCTGINARNPLQALSIALYNLSTIEPEISKKMELLTEALKYREKVNRVLEQIDPFGHFLQSRSQNYLALIQAGLAKIETDKEKKTEFLGAAISTMEKSLNLMEKIEGYNKGFFGSWTAKYNYWFGGILNELYLLTNDKKLIARAIEVYKDAGKYFDEEELTSRSAGIFWRIASLYDSLGDNLKSSANYKLASEKYQSASKKIPQLVDFYNGYSLYMQAWSEIEQAKYCHTRENYYKARIHYENAGRFHEQTENWNYLSDNYLAWAQMEQAEELSRIEKPQQAIKNFQNAIEYFKKTETKIKTKINKKQPNEENDLLFNILKVSDLRQRYCQARILMEEAKLLDREGRFLDSSTKYGDASQKITAIVDKVDNDVEGKELEYLAILCRAWEKMAVAEETTSSESYLEAAKLFDDAKELCFTQKGSFWALGNSSFCKGLAAKNKFQSTFEKSYHVMANKHVKQAAEYYKKAGFKTASEYAKATQRLFDAYIYMNSAEEEVDPDKKAKYYQLAEQLLQLSAGLFIKAKQPEKSVQVKEVLATVREEKALAASLNKVMQAPTITSSTLSFTAPTPTSEVSVGLQNFEHANVQANLVAGRKEVKVGESFCLSIELVNAGREPALLMRVEDFFPSSFVVVKKPEIYRIEDTSLHMKGKQLAPLKLVEVKLTLQSSKKGNYRLNPRVQYLDELGKKKSLHLKALEIKVEEVLLEDRMPTGTEELDSLLLGGIPRECAVVLSGPPCDERQMIVKNFLEAGTTQKEVTFYVTTEATGLEGLLENPNFFLFLCNPKPKTHVPDLPNVFKLQSKTDLTNLNIALTKAIRNIKQPITKKRLCVEILSDVLVKHGTNTTREWISGFITDLGAKGFTILGLLDPRMHDFKDSVAIINLFDGEISIIQSDDPLDCKKSIIVKKLRNQDYIKNPICLR